MNLGRLYGISTVITGHIININRLQLRTFHLHVQLPISHSEKEVWKVCLC